MTNRLIIIIVLIGVTNSLASSFVMNDGANKSTAAVSQTAPTIRSSTAVTALTRPLPGKHKLKVCPSLNIRNDLKSFEQLKGCNIIDGSLTIALVSNKTHPYESKDFENITFPELYEITEYLLLFRVQGLSTLSKLLPNLAIIRGRDLVSNYALIIYEMMHLQRVDLTNLTDILHGSVRIENNPNLCHISTINWEAICKHRFSPHFFNHNGNSQCDNRCPDNCRPHNLNITNPLNRDEIYMGDIQSFGTGELKNKFCWSSTTCQELCQESNISLPLSIDGKCCSYECAGGCYDANNSSTCYSCRNVLQNGVCVNSCDQNLFEYKGECISKDQCLRMNDESLGIDQCGRQLESPKYYLKAIKLPNEAHGRCQPSCAPGYEEDPNNRRQCKPCDKGKCRKVCTPEVSETFTVTNVDSLRELSGCNVINGSLEISMKGGKNVLRELEMSLRDTEEIRGYLKITRSYPIVTLGFLSNLRTINGSELDRGQYSLTIIDNPNLQELFIYNNTIDNDQKPLKIGGKIFVHLNPKLCPHRIDGLKSYAIVPEWDEKDVSLHTNGDKEICNTQKLEIEFLQSSARYAMIKFQNFALKMDDERSLLYYLISYREAPTGNVTMFDGRDGCNSQNDVWITIEQQPEYGRTLKKEPDKYQEAFIKVKPATRYALYIKTYMILPGTQGAISDILYFETAPDTPGIPREIAAIAEGPNSIQLTWLPPSKPNGVIESYYITITKIKELNAIEDIDICNSITHREDLTKSITKDEPTNSHMIPTHNTSDRHTSLDGSNISSPSTICSPKQEIDPVLKEEQITFQDIVIDIVYIINPCINISSSSRSIRKRSTDQIPVRSNQLVAQPLIIADTAAEPENLDNMIPRVSIAKATSRSITGSESLSGSSSSRPDKMEANQNTILFDQIHEDVKMEANITARSSSNPDIKMSVNIKGLKHYSLYSIEVVACHGKFVSHKTKLSNSYNRCGLQAITQVRTLPIKDADRIPVENITYIAANETSQDNLIVFKRPHNPNGAILAYRLSFKPVNNNGDIQFCINSTDNKPEVEYVANNLSPGRYTLSVQAVSLWPDSNQWSEPGIQIVISQTDLSPELFIAIILVVVLVLALTVASGTYVYQKKKHEERNRNLYASVNPDYTHYDPDDWEVEKTNLIVGALIGIGSFGLVYKGQLITDDGKINCAIKTVPPTATAKQRMDFLNEASIMKKIDTYHVVKLLGVVSTSNPVYVIMEYMGKGDLKNYLRSQRESHQNQKKTLVDGIYLMAAQIADGMAYLAANKFVHRDLAARNCMVGEDNVVKVGDFGLTRDIYVSNYYRRDTQGQLPVRWMAPESLKDNMYTSASDVWSFGVVLWEMVTFSASPYPGLSNNEVVKKVIHGLKMPRPENCPDNLFYIMDRCWRHEPKERLTFHDIVELLLPDTDNKLYPNCFYRKLEAKPPPLSHSRRNSLDEDDSGAPLNNGTEGGDRHENETSGDSASVPLCYAQNTHMHAHSADTRPNGGLKV